jgi:hypothetical protein
MACDFDYHRANKWPIYDRYGIFYTYVCDRCEDEKLPPHQRQHLATYEADEPIEGAA